MAWKHTCIYLELERSSPQVHDLVASTEKFPGSIQRIMLENVVHAIPDLRNIKSQAAQIQT
jgi:hypothetical protein